MAFLNPLLLLGTVGIGVPLLIHLLNRRRYRKLSWAAMRYLKTSVERNQRRMKLQDYLLLALRCLLVALLAIALARPALERLYLPWLESQVASVILLDRSASMAGTDPEGTTRFARAKAAALEAVRSLPAGSQASLWLLPASIGSPPIAGSSDTRFWEERLEGLEATAGFADLSSAIPQATDSLASLPGARKELVIITDCQRENWGDLDGVAETLENAAGEFSTSIFIVGDDGESLRRLGVSELTLSRSLPVVGHPLRFDVSVVNRTQTEAVDVPVHVDLDGKKVTEALPISRIPPGETVVVETYLTLEEPGYHHLRASLPEDAEPMDDQRSLVVKAFDKVRLLIVDGSLGAHSLESSSPSSFFLRHALAATGAEVSVADPADLNEAALENASAVFLVDVPEPTPADLIVNYVRQGGGLIIFPGPRVNADYYNHALSAVLPSSLDEPWAETRHLQASDYNHPVVAAWNDPDFGDLADAVFHRGWTLSLAEKESSSEVLSFASGSPALAERATGSGRTFLFASTADTSWNDLPRQADFVPLSSQILASILQPEDAYQVEAGKPYKRRVAPEHAGKPAVVFSLDNSEGQGLQTTIAGSGSDAWLTLDDTLTSGGHEALIDGRERLLMAVQPDRREASPETLASAQLDRLRSVARVIELDSGTSVASILASQRSGTELWKLLLALVAALAVLEMFLAQRFSRSK